MSGRNLGDAPRRRPRLAPATVASLAAFVTVAPAGGAMVLAATGERWAPGLQALPMAGALAVFLAAAIPLTALSLVPTHAASLCAGLLFGAAGGAAAALLVVVLAAAAAFLPARRPLAAGLRGLLATRPRAAAVTAALREAGEARTAGLVALVRLSPLMPFAGTNLLFAAAGIGARPFLLGSAVGLAPRVVAVAVAGAGLAELDLTRGTDLGLAAMGGVLTLLVLFVIGRLARRALARATGPALVEPGPAPD